MFAGILFAQAITFAVLSARIASNKNRDPFGWGVLGFLFGLFGFIAAIAVGEGGQDIRSRQSARRKSRSFRKGQSSSNKSRQQSNTQEFDPDEHEKKCPDCAEYIKLEARVCKHCGHEFSDEEVEGQIEKRRSKVEGVQQENRDETEDKTFDAEALTKGQKYYLRTHEFEEGSDQCNRCGVSKSYIIENRYKCKYSSR